MRKLAIASLLAASLGCLAAIASAQGGAAGLGSPEEPRRLVVTVLTRNDAGRVYCALWRGPRGYPTQRRYAVGQAMDRTLVRGRGHCVFEDVSPGEYAVAVFHDENSNDDLDRNFLGIPSEGTGSSNDAYNSFGPPSYDDARFVYPDVRVLRIEIPLHY